MRASIQEGDEGGESSIPVPVPGYGGFRKHRLVRNSTLKLELESLPQSDNLDTRGYVKRFDPVRRRGLKGFA